MGKRLQLTGQWKQFNRIWNEIPLGLRKSLISFYLFTMTIWQYLPHINKVQLHMNNWKKSILLLTRICYVITLVYLGHVWIVRFAVVKNIDDYWQFYWANECPLTRYNLLCSRTLNEGDLGEFYLPCLRVSKLSFNCKSFSETEQELSCKNNNHL